MLDRQTRRHAVPNQAPSLLHSRSTYSSPAARYNVTKFPSRTAAVAVLLLTEIFPTCKKMVGGGFTKQFTIKLLLSGNSPVAHHSSQVNMTTKEYNFKYKSHLCLTFARQVKELSRKRAGYLPSSTLKTYSYSYLELNLLLPGPARSSSWSGLHFPKKRPLIAYDFQDHKWPHLESNSALNPVIRTQYSFCHRSCLVLISSCNSFSSPLPVPLTAPDQNESAARRWWQIPCW